MKGPTKKQLAADARLERDETILAALRGFDGYVMSESVRHRLPSEMQGRDGISTAGLGRILSKMADDGLCLKRFNPQYAAHEYAPLHVARRRR